MTDLHLANTSHGESLDSLSSQFAADYWDSIAVFTPQRHSSLSLATPAAWIEVSPTPPAEIDSPRPLNPSPLTFTDELLAPATPTSEGLEPTPASDDSLQTAQSLGVLDTLQVLEDSVGTLDPNDYYRFELAEAGDLSLELSGLTSDADLQLLNADGHVIAGSYLSDRANEAITLAVAPGTYHARVYPYSGDTPYRLSLGTQVAAADTVGNSLSSALAIGVLSGSSRFQESIGGGDTDDYYRFELTETGLLEITLDALSVDADLELIDAAGRRLDLSVAAGTAPEYIARSLEAGSYFVRVYPYAGSTPYELNLEVWTSSNTAEYSHIYGYGLIDTAAAVTHVVGPAPGTAAAPSSFSNDLIQAPEVWSQGYSGDGVVVAVIDTGVDYTHPDLDDNIWTNVGEIAHNGFDDDGNGYVDDVLGWDFIDQDNNPMDLNGHGTHVAGIVAAENNGLGMTGVAYDAQVMPVRVLGLEGGSSDAIASGIRYAADNGAQVINLSLGSDFYNSDMENAIAYATSLGAVVVMAASNDGDFLPDYPARLAVDYGLAVGAVDSHQQMASFSNLAGTDEALAYVVAPGVNIYSTTIGSNYGVLDGTSMAAPHVAGAAALLLSADSSLSPAQMRSILTDTAVQLA